MATGQIHRVIEHLRKTVLVADTAGVSDGQLLECFVTRREESAFAVLLQRHGPMVLNVCQRVLGNHHDAEDAFQATFLVLARKASSIKPRSMVGNWLYGVAYKTALRARAVAVKRQVREKQMNPLPERESPAECAWPEVQRVLDEELSRLSDTYRVPIVLCDLEGKSQKEASRRLGVPEGTLSSRLSRGRAMLAKRLARRGVSLSAGALAAMLSQHGVAACMPSALASATLQAARAYTAGQSGAGLVSSSVVALTDGVLKAMLLTKLANGTASLLVVACLCISVAQILGANGRIEPVNAAESQAVQSGREVKDPAASVAPDGDPAKKLDPLLKLGSAERMKLLAKVVDKEKDFVSAARGTVAETLVERGGLEAVEASDVICRLRPVDKNSRVAIIKWVIDDGSLVKQGDKVIEFDNAALTDALRKQNAVAAKAEAERKRAADAHERIQSENRIDVKLAELDLRLAELALRQYKGKDALQKETLAIQVERAALLLERVKLQGAPKLEKTSDRLNATTAVLAMAVAQQKAIQEDIAHCVINAPQDGFLVYYVPEQRPGPGGRLLAPGEPVRNGQILLRISDLKRIAIRTLVPEGEIHRVRVGQAAKIKVDAFPLRAWTGKVSAIANHPSQTAWLRSNKKVYEVTVAIDGQNKDVKSGMSGEATIILVEKPNCLRLLSSAVLGKGKDTFCYIRTDNELHVRRITVGLSDGKLTEIHDGLKEGELVLRDPGAIIERLKKITIRHP